MTQLKYLILKHFQTTQLYTNKMFQNETIIQVHKMFFETTKLYKNKMFQNETIICEYNVSKRDN